MAVKRICALYVAVVCVFGATPVAVGQTNTDDVLVHDLGQDDAAVDAYWTPERIDAIPSDPPVSKPPADRPDGAAWNGDGRGAPTVGRLFFVDRNGNDSSCTATIVRSRNRSTAVTGGHCVHSQALLGGEGRWHTKLLFAPGYRDGETPFGRFVAHTAVAHRAWVEQDQMAGHDQAFVTLGANEAGRSAADAVGAEQRIAFDSHDDSVEELGYPRGASAPDHKGRPEFTGRWLAHCWGTAQVLDQERGLRGVPCDMGGGSSGGPRLTDLDPDSGIGTVIGVNTQGDEQSHARYLIGPQFSHDITEPLYDAAQR